MVNQRSKLPLMAHLVLGYPTLAESLRTAAQYIVAGVEILELQIPFSHPTADGPVITAACQEATRLGVSVSDCIEAIRGLHAQFPEQEIMVMSYLNRIYTFGFQEFVTEMKTIGVRHLIIPDLPVDSRAAEDLRDLTISKKSGLSNLNLVPVLAANTPDPRVEKLLAMGFDFFYLMSDFKITGSGFSLHPRLKAIIQKIRAHPSTNLPAVALTKEGHHSTNHPRIGIGFGISTPEQALKVVEDADVAIIGSALIQAQNAGKLTEYLESLRQAFNNQQFETKH
ncbi:MAG: tryptophan synthase subunit alpha [Phycisphaerae bacterium]|nr:tryptophan synthase subunit alpha [Saprospiraceae bacterium]